MPKHAGDRESDDAVSACRVAGSTSAEGFFNEARGLEEFQIGTTYHRPRPHGHRGRQRVVHHADDEQFQLTHLDAAWAGQQPGFRRAAQNPMFTRRWSTNGAQHKHRGQPGFSEVLAPNRSSTATRFMQMTVCTGKRESKSRPGKGIVTLSIARNQHGEVGPRGAHDAGPKAVH